MAFFKHLGHLVATLFLEKYSQTIVEREAGLACGGLMHCEALKQDFKAESDCADGRNACHKNT